MSRYERAIPPPALARLRAAYQHFEELAAVICETLEIPPNATRNLDIERGVFVFEAEGEPLNGQMLEHA